MSIHTLIPLILLAWLVILATKASPIPTLRLINAEDIKTPGDQARFNLEQKMLLHQMRFAKFEHYLIRGLAISLIILTMAIAIFTAPAKAQNIVSNSFAVQKLCYDEKKVDGLMCAMLAPRPPLGISSIRHLAARLYEVSRHGRGDYATRANALYEGWAKELGQGLQPRPIGIPNAGLLIETAFIRRLEEIAAGKDVMSIRWSSNTRKLMNDSLNLLETADVNYLKDWRDMRQKFFK